MKNGSSLGKSLLTIIVAFIFLVIVGVSCNSCSEQQTQKETDEFEAQMQQDPETWDKEQRDRYNDFMEWEEKQQENK